jgi:hypothetical protein
MSEREGRVPAATAAGIILIIDPKKMWPVMALRGALAILFGGHHSRGSGVSGELLGRIRLMRPGGA